MAIPLDGGACTKDVQCGKLGKCVDSKCRVLRNATYLYCGD